MTSINNTQVDSTFLKDLTAQITTKNNGSSQYFDNTKAINKAKVDATLNDSETDTIYKLANLSKTNSNAKTLASAAGANLKTLKETGQFGQKWSIKGAPVIKDNTVTLKLTNNKGKEIGTKVFTYAPDGSYVVTCNLTVDGKKQSATEIYDSNKQLRKKTQTEKDGTVKEWQYDSNGKLNQTKITTKSGKITTAFYDDNEQKTYQTEKDGVKTTSHKYEYDSKGKLAGEYKVSKYDKTGESKTTITPYKKDSTETVFTKSAQDGTSVLKTYDKSGNIKTQVNKDKSGNITKEQTFSNYKTNADGTKTIDVVVKENGKTLYQTDSYDKSGKLTKQERYTDSNKKTKIAQWVYSYNKSGQKTKTVKEYYVPGVSKTTTTVTYDTNTGKEKSKTSKTETKPNIYASSNDGSSGGGDDADQTYTSVQLSSSAKKELTTDGIRAEKIKGDKFSKKQNGQPSQPERPSRPPKS